MFKILLTAILMPFFTAPDARAQKEIAMKTTTSEATQTQQMTAILPAVKMYPNAATGLLNISLSGGTGTYTVRFYDKNGMQVCEKDVNPGISELPTCDLEAGLYVARVSRKQGGIVAVEKIQLIR